MPLLTAAAGAWLLERTTSYRKAWSADSGALWSDRTSDLRSVVSSYGKRRQIGVQHADQIIHSLNRLCSTSALDPKIRLSSGSRSHA